MKKFISCLLIIVMVFALCACGAKTETTTSEQVDDVKIGLICLHDENSTYDLNFINAFNSACEKNGVEHYIKTNIDENAECYEAAAEFADSGCNIVFADSFGHEDYMMQAAQEFPEVQFCHATGTNAHTAGIPNYHNAFASIYEGRFIDGVAAGLKLNEMIENGEITEDEAVVGYVGAYQYAEVISGYTSFFLGVRYVCPNATMIVKFTDSWYDETLEKEVANQLINSGCVIISGHADSMGAPTACETAGVPFVFYNGSLESVCPNTFIISTRIDWEPYFDYIINAVRNGEQIVDDYVGDISTGSVVMTDVNTAVAATGTEEIVDALINAFIEGTVDVFDTKTFTVNGEHIDSYVADVDSDEAYTPDTEVIVDGVFYESKFRSAPYFDLAIDGITIQ